MSEHDDPIESLLARERAAPGMPDAVSARLASRLGIALPPDGGAGPSGGGGGPAGGGAAAAAAPLAGASALTSGAGAAAWSSLRIAQLGLVFVLGALAGVTADRMLTADGEPEVIVTPRPAVETHRADPAAAPMPAAPPTALATEEPSADPPIAHPTHAPDEAQESSDAERLWLERAEAAFGAGDSLAALSALDAHARRFPHGRLSEERDALRVRALYSAGRTGEADAQAERFATAHPGSIFVRQIERARARAAEQTHTPVTVP